MTVAREGCVKRRRGLPFLKGGIEVRAGAEILVLHFEEKVDWRAEEVVHGLVTGDAWSFGAKIALSGGGAIPVFHLHLKFKFVILLLFVFKIEGDLDMSFQISGFS